MPYLALDSETVSHRPVERLSSLGCSACSHTATCWLTVLLRALQSCSVRFSAERTIQEENLIAQVPCYTLDGLTWGASAHTDPRSAVQGYEDDQIMGATNLSSDEVLDTCK